MMPTELIARTIRPTEGFYASEVESPRRLPVLTFLPTGYEPNYPYPLLVFFHGRGGSERQIVQLAPRVSRRNYICMALRGPQQTIRRDDGQIGYDWSNDWRTAAYTEEYLFQAIEQACLTYHIHPRRIYLAGICEGAAHAYGLGLAFPEKFAGVIAMNGEMPPDGPLLRLPELRRLRVFIGHGIANATIPLTMAKDTFRLLYTAGLSVDLRTYPTTHRIHPDMLRDIDRWIMDRVSSERIELRERPYRLA